MVRRVWNIAHRGASSELPENTVPAFERAIEDGADVIEADVRLSSDSHPLILHDAEVDRTTDGSGLLRTMTAATARDLDAGSGERIPRLAEVLEIARGRVRINVDIKDAEATDIVAAAVREADMLDHVTYISFLPEVWDRLGEIAPESPIVHLVDSPSVLAGLAMGDAGSHRVATGVGLKHTMVGSELVERLHRHGLGVFAWTVDEETEMRRLIDCDINGIVTNRPALLAGVLRERLGPG